MILTYLRNAMKSWYFHSNNQMADFESYAKDKTMIGTPPNVIGDVLSELKSAYSASIKIDILDYGAGD